MNDICLNCGGFIFEVDRDPDLEGGILWSHINTGCDDPTPRFTIKELEIISIALEEWETDCTEAQRDDKVLKDLEPVENIEAITALSYKVDQMIGERRKDDRVH